MDKIDVLGTLTERHGVLSAAIQAEADDAALNSFVEEAATGLRAPIALVTLVLERVQLFKAHYGLPADLAASCMTERDVSFCQFVVQSGEPFEVVDAESDTRIPQALVKRYGIQAYLGIPVRVDEVVVGSLCVLDTKARGFSADDRKRLTELAQKASTRLEQIAESRRRPQQSLTTQVTVPGLAELRQSVEPIKSCTASAQVATATLQSLLQLVSHTRGGGTAPPGVLDGALEQSLLAMEDLGDSLSEIELSSSDVDDCAAALQSVLEASEPARLSELLRSAQDLSRSPCRTVGGAPLPSLAADPFLAAPRAIAVALISGALNRLAQHMCELGLTGGIVMDVRDDDASVVVSLSSPVLPATVYEQMRAALVADSSEDPTASLRATATAISVSLTVARSAEP